MSRWLIFFVALALGCSKSNAGLRDWLDRADSIALAFEDVSLFPSKVVFSILGTRKPLPVPLKRITAEASDDSDLITVIRSPTRVSDVSLGGHLVNLKDRISNRLDKVQNGIGNRVSAFADKISDKVTDRLDGVSDKLTDTFSGLGGLAKLGGLGGLGGKLTGQLTSRLTGGLFGGGGSEADDNDLVVKSRTENKPERSGQEKDQTQGANENNGNGNNNILNQEAQQNQTQPQVQVGQQNAETKPQGNGFLGIPDLSVWHWT